MPTNPNQPDILDPGRTRPAKPPTPATVPMPGKGIDEDRGERPERPARSDR